MSRSKQLKHSLALYNNVVTTRPQESSFYINWVCLHWYGTEAKLLVEEGEQ
jgi:hypothetical protein